MNNSLRQKRRKRQSTACSSISLHGVLLLSMIATWALAPSADIATSEATRASHHTKSEVPPITSRERGHTKKAQLAFLHITKTGGSAIEAAAASAGIMWGACHFMSFPALGCTTPRYRNQSNPDEKVRSSEVVKVPWTSTYSLWHIPLRYFKEEDRPYKDDNTTQTAFFTVVRNPYTRAVSEFYCPWSGHAGAAATKEVLNSWLQRQIEITRSSPRQTLYPQHKYIWDDQADHGETMAISEAASSRRQLVQHIVRMESIHQDFASLMKDYNLNVSLPKLKKNAATGSKLTVRDLSNASIALINEYYKLDFELLGYNMMEVASEG